LLRAILDDPNAPFHLKQLAAELLAQISAQETATPVVQAAFVPVAATSAGNTEPAWSNHAAAAVETTQASTEGHAPRGFDSSDQFANFGTNLLSGLTDAGYGEVQPILQGSAVTGKSFRTGEPFDRGRVSDFDIGLASQRMLQKANGLGIALRSNGTRTGPLGAHELAILGLTCLAKEMKSSCGRPVNFMIYDSTENALSREGAPSRTIPKGKQHD
jgi:hypothetical protein